jgi:hypothetical protein
LEAIKLCFVFTRSSNKYKIDFYDFERYIQRSFTNEQANVKLNCTFALDALVFYNNELYLVKERKFDSVGDQQICSKLKLQKIDMDIESPLQLIWVDVNEVSN